ncbi:MAG TPA: terminase large subunit, partial [Coleofasciculaceae cyanobacterium]
MTWSTACPDWQARIVEGRSLIPPPLFPDEAAASLEVFRSLRIRDVAGQPTAGEVSRQWLLDFVASVFGAYDPETERQMIREYLLVIAKKNTKSTAAAGIMMTALIRNPRHSAEFLIIAPTKEIAGNSFQPASSMAEALNQELEAEGRAPLFRVYLRERRIVHLETRAELKIIAADSDTVGGTKATAVLVDELWLFGKRAGAMSMFREAIGGLAARPEGFVIYLSTMSDEAPAGEFAAKLDYGRKVRDGEITDPGFLPVIYEFPPDMLKAKAHREPRNWRITNPNLGASVDEAFLAREFEKARAAGDAA